MSVGGNLDMLATRVAEDIKAISRFLDQANGLAPDIKTSHLINYRKRC